MIPPLDPVATVASYEGVRHGETVHSEAGVSDSFETRCHDTGIQLAADQLNVPGKSSTDVIASLSACNWFVGFSSTTVEFSQFSKVLQLALQKTLI